MTTVKRAFTLPEDVSQALDEVSGGNASAYVTEAVRRRIDRERAAARIREAYGTIDQGAYDMWVARLTGSSLTGSSTEAQAS
jgi:hypothetical protein